MLLFLAVVTIIFMYRYIGDADSEIKEVRKDCTNLREKLLDALNTTNSRETYLKRALEDLAFGGEIDRARFVLEVVYGKSSKK